MSTDDEWRAQRDRHDRFAQTELGRLFIAYNHACISYWRVDADDRIGPKRLGELDAAAKTTEKALMAKLMELAGV